MVELVSWSEAVVSIGSEKAKGSEQIPDSHIPWPAEHTPAKARVFAQNIVDVACLVTTDRLRCVAAVVQALFGCIHPSRRLVLEFRFEVSI